MVTENPYAIGTAPFRSNRDINVADPTDGSRRPQIKWTVADAIMILVSGLAAFGVWGITGLIAGFVIYDAVESSRSVVRHAAPFIIMFNVTLWFLVSMVAMLLTFRSIRYLKWNRWKRNPAALIVVPEEIRQ